MSTQELQATFQSLLRKKVCGFESIILSASSKEKDRGSGYPVDQPSSSQTALLGQPGQLLQPHFQRKLWREEENLDRGSQDVPGKREAEGCCCYPIIEERNQRLARSGEQWTRGLNPDSPALLRKGRGSHPQSPEDLPAHSILGQKEP